MATSLEIFDCEQGSLEWVHLRLGIPTASEFSTVMAVGKQGGESVTRRALMNRLAAEVLTGSPSDGAFESRHTLRGKEQETEAAEMYSFINNVELQHVGFVKNGIAGCSPDRLIGEDGGLEIKSGLSHIVIDAIRRDKFPPEHMAQCMGSIWVTERSWWDLVLYAPGLPLFQKRVYRDEEYIKKLKEAVEQFYGHMMQVVEFVRRYG